MNTRLATNVAQGTLWNYSTRNSNNGPISFFCYLISRTNRQSPRRRTSVSTLGPTSEICPSCGESPYGLMINCSGCARQHHSSCVPEGGKGLGAVFHCAECSSPQACWHRRPSAWNGFWCLLWSTLKTQEESILCRGNVYFRMRRSIQGTWVGRRMSALISY